MPPCLPPEPSCERGLASDRVGVVTSRRVRIASLTRERRLAACAGQSDRRKAHVTSPENTPPLDPVLAPGVESVHAGSLALSNAEAAMKYTVALVLMLAMVAGPLTVGVEESGSLGRCARQE